MSKTLRPKNEMWVVELCDHECHDDKAARLIIFEQDDHTGARSVVDIYECRQQDLPRYGGHFWWAMDGHGSWDDSEMFIREVSEDGLTTDTIVDTGRCRRGDSKFTRACEELIK